MDETPPVSVILPTVEWTAACEEVADQLGDDDELLVVCDSKDDPVAERAAERSGEIRSIVAGEPEACSGKANAVAAGMDAARHDRLVWTDDDFHHPPDWLETLRTDYERRGPTTELPFFVGRDPLSLLLEPLYAVGGTLGVYAGDRAWAGAVIFDREDLDEKRFLAELRRTVSDDGLLSEHIETTPVRRTRRVAIGGTLRESLERHVRFTQIVFRHDPKGTAVSNAVVALFAAVGLAFPVPTLVFSTLLVAAVYAKFGVRRWTALLAYPSLLVQIPLSAYALARRTFVWGGRRYRWRGKFDVSIVDREA